MKYLKIIILTIALAFAIPANSLAIPYTATIDISSIGENFQLALELYSNNGVPGDSYVLVDNIFISNTSSIDTINFENGTSEGFNVEWWAPPNLLEVIPSDEASWWADDFVLQIGEDTSAFPVLLSLIFKNFSVPDALTLSFDYEFFCSEVEGFWGDRDSFVASLVHPLTYAPLISGITPDPWNPGGYYGDFLEVTGEEHTVTSDPNHPTTTIPIPEPCTALLLVLGLTGMIALASSHAKSKA